MKYELEPAYGGITAPMGFLAGGAFAGLKRYSKEKLDIGLLISENLCAVAGTFTQNQVISPSTAFSRHLVQSKRQVRGVIVNSGNANCSVGKQGYHDAEEMATLAAKHVNAQPHEILVASTGLIGVVLPMGIIRKGIPLIEPTRRGNLDFAHAIWTTDTKVKESAVRFMVNGKSVTVGGAAKGSGMIHPNMATMLAFVTTDAAAEQSVLQGTLSAIVAKTFNQIDVDGDQSTNDMVLLFASGSSGVTITETYHDAFVAAVSYVCEDLARSIAADGERTGHLITGVVEQAKTDADARKVARHIVSSVLVKTAIHGRDPNWGRIMMALGNADVTIDEGKIDIFLNGIQIVHAGIAIPFDHQSVVQALERENIEIKVSLNAGNGFGKAWGSDLTEGYVEFNSAYTT